MFAVLVPESTILAADEVPAAHGDPATSWITVILFIVAAIVLILMARTRFWRPPSQDGRPLPSPWRLSPAWGAGMFALVLITGSYFSGLALDRLPPGASPTLAAAIPTWGAYAGGLLACLPAAIAWRRHPPIPDAAPIMPAPRAWLVGVLVLLPALALVSVASSIGQQIQIRLAGDPPSPLAHETLRLMVEAPRDPGWWLLGAAAILGAPILEEILYRGFIQQSIRRVGVGPWPAVVITAGLFSLMHVPALPADGRISALAGLTVFGVVLGLLRERTGRVDAGIVTHAGFNLCNLLLAHAPA
ncbi:MAG: CPBP family intramembrane glutamic endopeptidase [Planctomycetota bacterium]|nr:CPBP family intramembrane glutamic endopeptidase [Planctomycetota bacterium]